MDAPIIDLCFQKGKTLDFALQYASEKFAYVPITGVPSLAPVRLTVVGHGLPDGWPFDVESVKKPSDLNGENYIATVIDDDTVEINDLVGSSWRHMWSAGGVVKYLIPQDITGWSARAMFRRNIHDNSPVLTFHSDGGENPDGQFVVDPSEHSFTLLLPESVSKSLKPMCGVWDAEVIDPNGAVYALVGLSPFEITDEATR